MEDFNLWNHPWIPVIRLGEQQVERVTAREAMAMGQLYRGQIYEQSPLHAAGIYRLLTMMTQMALRPQTGAEIKGLWDTGQMPAAALDEFERKFATRFNLYGGFLQDPGWPENLPAELNRAYKSVTKLAFDLPSGSNHTLWGARRRWELCPACVAGGLAAMPPFAQADSGGYWASLNGQQAGLVTPVGPTLFHSLVAGLVLPENSPAPIGDEPWWTGGPTGDGDTDVTVLRAMMYFPRSARLYPTAIQGCVRCGAQVSTGVRIVAWDKPGPKVEAAGWRDPALGYRQDKGVWKTRLPLRRKGEITAPAWFNAGRLLSQPQNDEMTRPVLVEQSLALGLATAWRYTGALTATAKLEGVQDVVLPHQSLTIHPSVYDLPREVVGLLKWVGGDKYSPWSRVSEDAPNKFWAAMESPFMSLLAGGSIYEGWAEAVREAAMSAFQAAVTWAGRGQDGLRQQLDAALTKKIADYRETLLEN